MAQAPTGLLRQPASGGDDGALADAIEQPLADEIANRNRGRTPQASALADGVDIVPITSEDEPAITTTRTRATAAGHATVVGLADEKPRIGRYMEVRINTVRVFGGRVFSAELDDAGILRVQGYDDTRRLLRTPFTGSYYEQSIGQVVRDVAHNAAVGTDVDEEFLALDQLEIEGEPIEPGYRRIIDEEGEDALSGEQTTATGDGDGPSREHLTVTYDFQEANSAEVLDDLAAVADALWWVSPRNVLRFTAEPDIQEIGVNGITNPQAGTKELPYQKVVVVGASKEQAEGERRRPRASKNPIVGVAGDESAPPARTYRTDRKPAITTQRMADNVANSVWEEVQRQRKTGTIRLVGRAAVFPDDVVTLPPYYDDEEYLVDTVTHEITEDSAEDGGGFMTTLKCAGTV